MTLDSIEKKIRHTLRKKLPGCTISDRDSGNPAIRILHVRLFSKEQRNEVGDSQGPYVTITINTSEQRQSWRSGGTEAAHVKVDGGYGEGATRRYKIKGGDFNPRLFELITDYHQRKLEEARAQQRSSLAETTTRAEMVRHLEAFARPLSKGYPEWIYRGHGFSPKPLSDGRVRIGRYTDPLVWPSEMKAFLDLYLDFEEACRKLGR